MSSLPVKRYWMSQLPLLITTTCLWVTDVHASSTVFQASRIVSTRYGRLQGITMPLGSPLAPVDAYLGVPYAAPPTGIHRFGPTRNPTPWLGVKTADQFGAPCPQRFPAEGNDTSASSSGFGVHRNRINRLEVLLRNQSEDCLFLNIYVPTQGRSSLSPEKFAVMVLIHGESYEFGSGQVYDGSVIASYSRIIFITLDFRLGFLGFLNPGQWPKGKGRLANYGLMDQVAALHWIRQNIAEFHGDPDRITLVGHRYGASLIHFLMKSPAVVPGLFHRAILLSGSSLAPWSLSTNAEELAQRLSSAAGCDPPTDPSASSASEALDSVLTCMRHTPLEHLLQAASTIPRRFFVPGFGPSIDGVVIRARQLTEETPPAVYDFLTGVTGLEAGFLPEDIGVDLLKGLVRETYRFHQAEILATLLNEYTDWEEEGRCKAVEALSDGLFVAPAVSMADSLVEQHSQQRINGYFYVMDAAWVKKMLHEWDFELSLLLGAPVQNSRHQNQEYIYSKQDIISAEALMLLFTNFAKSGNPNEGQQGIRETFLISRERNYFKTLSWENYEPTQRNFLQIGPKPKLGKHFRSHRLSIWLQLIPELHRVGQLQILHGHGLISKDKVLGGDTKTRDEMTCVTPATASSRSSNSSESLSAAHEGSLYSTVLGVTIAVGCSLLIVNVLAFAGLYYWRDRRRRDILHRHAIVVDDVYERNCRNTYELKANGLPATRVFCTSDVRNQAAGRNYYRKEDFDTYPPRVFDGTCAPLGNLLDTSISVALPPDKSNYVPDTVI